MMISNMLRQSSYFLLACGVLIGIVDATRSVATNVIQLTSLGPVLEEYLPYLADGLVAAKTILSLFSIGGWNVGRLVDYVNAIPVALLMAAFFVLFYGVANRNREESHF
jgi:hypothetical protein